jgi:putative transposase
MTKRVNLVMHLTREELEDRYKKERNGKIKERALAIMMLYGGTEEKEVARTLNRCVKTIRNWVASWNKNGYDGLTPHFTGGPKPKLPDSEWDKIVKEIEDKDMDLKQVTVYVNTTRGVKYAYTGVWRVLRKRMHVPYGKPYPKNAKRPEDADAVLKKS